MQETTISVGDKLLIIVIFRSDFSVVASQARYGCQIM